MSPNIDREVLSSLSSLSSLSPECMLVQDVTADLEDLAAMSKRGQFGDAIKMYEECLAEHNRDFAVAFEYASLRIAQGCYGHASTFLTEVVDSSDFDGYDEIQREILRLLLQFSGLFSPSRSSFRIAVTEVRRTSNLVGVRSFLDLNEFQIQLLIVRLQICSIGYQYSVEVAQEDFRLPGSSPDTEASLWQDYIEAIRHFLLGKRVWEAVAMAEIFMRHSDDFHGPAKLTDLLHEFLKEIEPFEVTDDEEDTLQSLQETMLAIVCEGTTRVLLDCEDSGMVTDEDDFWDVPLTSGPQIRRVLALLDKEMLQPSSVSLSTITKSKALELLHRAKQYALKHQDYRTLSGCIWREAALVGSSLESMKCSIEAFELTQHTGDAVTACQVFRSNPYRAPATSTSTYGLAGIEVSLTVSQLPYIKVSYRERLTKAINENIHPRDPLVLRDGPKSHGSPLSDSSFLHDQSTSATALLDPTQAVSQKPRKLICAIDDTSMDRYAESFSRRHESHSLTQSNISRISRAVKPEDSSKASQIVYYQAGSFATIWDQIAGKRMTHELRRHLSEAYSFLASNYKPGDTIFLIGFSRGGCVAKGLAGLIGQFGLLNKRGLPYLADILSDWETAGDPKSPGSIFWEHFRDFADPEKQHSPRTPSNDPSQAVSYLEEYKIMLRNRGLTHMIPKHEPGFSDVTVHTVAVFDSLGGPDIPVLPWLQRLFGLQPSIPDTRWFDTLLEESTANAFQALALDEHRPLFPPAVWRKVSGSKTNLKQVWFPATHNDCGGIGSDTVAASVTLAWMMDQLSGSRIQSRHLDHFDPSDWIEFDNSYLSLQQRTRIVPSQDNFTVEGFLWGAVYAILKLLHGLLGRTVRTPGQYTFKDPDPHSEPASTPRLETKEFIHSCVRARVSEGWNRQGTGRYKPEALRRWRLIGEDEEDASSVTRARWEWRGSKLRMPQEFVLDEDIPETLEMQLLERLEPVLAGSIQKGTDKETKKEV